MNVEILSAIRQNTDLCLDLPCGASLAIPADVLQGWANTPASEEFRAAATQVSGGKLDAPPNGTILDILIKLLPTLLPVLLPLLVNSLTPKPADPVAPPMPVN